MGEVSFSFNKTVDIEIDLLFSRGKKVTKSHITEIEVNLNILKNILK